MTEPHHVALVHDGRVLVDETGALPSFLPDQHLGSLTHALQLVGAAIATAPVAKLPDGSRLHVVGSRGAPPTGTFIPPSALSDASLAAAVLDSLRTAPGRPAWFLPGWFDLVEAWIDSVLAGSGRRRTHPIEAVKMWSISAVAKVSTDAGDLWLKAPCEHFMSEAPVHATVAGLFPELVPALVAIEESQGWLAMEAMTGTEDDTSAPGAGFESTYADPWRTAYPLADVDRTLALAPIVDSVFQAITFDGIVNSTEPMLRWELGGVVADVLRALPAKVTTLP